jgi:hypothetical protein
MPLSPFTRLFLGPEKSLIPCVLFCSLHACFSCFWPNLPPKRVRVSLFIPKSFWHIYCAPKGQGETRMETILYRSDHVKAPHRLANIDWVFHIFWATYFSIIVGIVAYVTG